jgi:hypothetical protein
MSHLDCSTLRSPSASLTLSALRWWHCSCSSHSSHWVNTVHTIIIHSELDYDWWCMVYIDFWVYGDSVRRWKCLVRVVWLFGKRPVRRELRFHICLAWSLCHTHHDTEVLGTTDRTSSCSVVSSPVGLHAWTRYCTVFVKCVCRCDCTQELCPEVFDRSNFCRYLTSSSGISWLMYLSPLLAVRTVFELKSAVICS